MQQPASEHTFDGRSLRLAATLLLTGQLSYVVITLLHTGGEANDHASPSPRACAGSSGARGATRTSRWVSR